MRALFRFPRQEDAFVPFALRDRRGPSAKKAPLARRFRARAKRFDKFRTAPSRHWRSVAISESALWAKGYRDIR